MSLTKIVFPEILQGDLKNDYDYVVEAKKLIAKGANAVDLDSDLLELSAELTDNYLDRFSRELKRTLAGSIGTAAWYTQAVDSDFITSMIPI